MSCFHQLPGRLEVYVQASYIISFFSSGNSYATLTPTCICYSYRILSTEVNLRPLIYSIVYKSLEVSAQEMFMQV